MPRQPLLRPSRSKVGTSRVALRKEAQGEPCSEEGTLVSSGQREREGTNLQTPMSTASLEKSKRPPVSSRGAARGRSGNFLWAASLSILASSILFLLVACVLYYFDSLEYLTPGERVEHIGPMILGLLTFIGGPVGLWLLRRWRPK